MTALSSATTSRATMRYTTMRDVTLPTAGSTKLDVWEKVIMLSTATQSDGERATIVKKKTVIHIFHDDPDSITTGSRVAQRILEIAAENDVVIEVFCFGPAQRKLGISNIDSEAIFNRQINELIAAGVTVGACVNAARADNAEETLRTRGLNLEVARDVFLRFTLEGATVITF